MSEVLRAPFAYPGGKSRVAELCWRGFGSDVPSYVEPLCGSAAMLFGRPGGPGRYETINDSSGHICNVWRAIKSWPVEVARHANNHPDELDLRARTRELVARGPHLVELLSGKPGWCDPESAGWWIWCQALALGPDWLKQRNPCARKGSRKGVFGTEADAGRWLLELAARLQRVLVCCGDWSRVVTDSALGLNTTGTTPCAIFFDPPYPDEELDYGAAPDVAPKVAAWCGEHGDDPRLRIVLAGHVGDYDLPGWRALNWGGSGGTGRAKRGDNEALWFSPYCLPLEGAAQRSLFG